MEPVSPELVLVDRALAERVHSVLREPDDTLARIEAIVQASRRAALAQRNIEIPRFTEPRVIEPRSRSARPGRRSRRRRPAALAGGVAAGTLIVGLLFGVRVDLAGNPAGADTTVVVTAPAPPVVETTTPTETQPSPRPAATPKPQPTPQPQRFAWAPVPEASAYHVELFLASSRVFATDTARPALTIPARWKLDGRPRRLVPGEYRWYVWPVISGRRAAEAVVQARLTIPQP